MPTKRKPRGRPLKPLPRGPVGRIVVSMSRPEAVMIRNAARRAHLTVAAWCRNILVPLALNALADEAATSNAVDRIHQQVKVAEQTLTI